jgi:short-subunit dehydrogenase
MDHNNTTALITGASSGLGEQFARRLAERGANLILVARRRDRLDELADKLRADGVNVAVYNHDLSKPRAGTALAELIAADGLTIDTLINNAGMGTHGDFASQDPDALADEIQLNVASLVDLTSALLPQLLQRRRGALVNIASTSAYQPTPSMAVYGAGKAFVLSFTEALAYETRRSGLKVLAVSPGPMHTEFFDKLGTTRPGVGRWQTPDQVVEFTMRTLDRHRPPPSVISGALNALPIAAARFTPRRLVLAITGRAIGA